LRRRIQVIFKIAVPTNDGEQISEKMNGSILFLIYETYKKRTIKEKLSGVATV
jgi:hypothetical protein